VGRGRCRVGWAAVEAGEGGGVVATGKRRRWIGDDGSKGAGGASQPHGGEGTTMAVKKGVKRGSHGRESEQKVFNFGVGSVGTCESARGDE
jgi:hypothetical protein